MVNFMMQSVYHAMNRFDNDERIIAMPPFNPFERHGRIIVPRVQINANPVSVTFASSNFVDLTADSDEETVQLAPCFGQEVGDIDQTSASRRELRGHSLFDQASRGRSAPAVSTDSAVSRTRGARAVVAATSSSSGAQRRRAMSTVCIVPTAPPAPEVVNDANRRRRSSGLIELSDSDESDSSSDSASDENIEDAMSAIAAVRNQILGNMNQKTTASRTLPNLRRR